MDKGVRDKVLTVVQLLAKSSDHSKLSPMQVNVFNQNIESLIGDDEDELVKSFLAMVREAHSILKPNVGNKLTGYP